jgi:hypothetical protein
MNFGQLKILGTEMEFEEQTMNVIKKIMKNYLTI